MLRYFYFLIYMHLCFCYEYTEEKHEKQFRRHNENSDTVQRKSRMVQFDASSFIGNSAIGNIDYEPYVYGNISPDNRRTQSEDYYEAPINENKKTNDNADHLNIESNPKSVHWNNDLRQGSEHKVRFGPNSMFDEIRKRENKMNLENKVKQNIQNKLLFDRALNQNPEKKCAFKHMRVPFFSHKTSSPKKQKKRKLFCINCAEKFTNDAIKQDANSEITLSNGRLRRTYRNLCPKCIKKLLKRPSKNKGNIKQVHTSRDYQFSSITQDNPTEGRSKTSYNNKDYNGLIYGREKRNDNEERKRQLNELAEVEKKINRVKIEAFSFEKGKLN